MKNEPFYPDDELDGLLRSGLGDFSPKAPDHLWSGIEARLPERRRRPLFLWWWVAFGLMIFSGGAAYLLSGKKHRGTIVENHPGSIPIPKPVATDIRNEVKAEHEPENIQHPVIQKKRSAGSVETQSGNATGINIVSGISASGNVDDNKPTAFSRLPQRNREIRISDFNLSMAPDAYPSLFVAGAKAQTGAEAGTKPRKTLTRKYHIGLLAGPVWEWESQNPHTAHGAIAVHTSNPVSGWQTGVSAGFDLNPRWRVNTGLWRQTFVQNVSHHATLQLRDGVLMPPATYTDPKTYQFEYALLSGGGGTTRVRVRISEEDLNTTMPDDEPFTLAMQTTHRRTDWLVPLSVQRRFGRGRWQGGLQAGALLSIPGGRAVRVDHFTEQCADLCYTVGHTPEFVVQDAGQTSLSWLTGAELECRIAPHWKIAFNPVLFGQNKRNGLVINTILQFKF